jgi:hypothetical protein
MKKVFLFLLMLTGLSSCGPHLYSTLSAGKDNVSYVLILKKDRSDKTASLFIDNKIYSLDKIYSEKMARKAQPIVTTPGKHQIKIISNGKVVLDENVFLGLQETKKIVL